MDSIDNHVFLISCKNNKKAFRQWPNTEKSCVQRIAVRMVRDYVVRILRTFFRKNKVPQAS